MTTKQKGEARQVSALTPVLLLATSAALSLLALFQWMELVVVRSGGNSVCNVSQTVNCEAVWNSEFASRIHSLVGLPVAGLGEVWALTAFCASCFFVHRALSDGSIRLPIAAIRLIAAIGLLVCLVLAVQTIRGGALCLTCLGTIALVVLFSLVAWKLLPDPIANIKQELWPAAAWSAGPALATYLILLGPGVATPRKQTQLARVEGVSPSSSSTDGNSDALKTYLGRLSELEQQAVANSLASYRRSPAP